VARDPTGTDHVEERYMSDPLPDLRDVIVGAIADAADRPPDELRDDVDLLDLGLDSLDFARILIDIEDAVGAEVPPHVLDRIMDEAPEVITLRSILDLLTGWDTSDGDLGFHPRTQVVAVSADDLRTS
jgi:acyl carrier protein